MTWALNDDRIIDVRFAALQTQPGSRAMSVLCEQRTLLRRVGFGWSLPTPSLVVYSPSIALGSCHRDVPRSGFFSGSIRSRRRALHLNRPAHFLAGYQHLQGRAHSRTRRFIRARQIARLYALNEFGRHHETCSDVSSSFCFPFDVARAVSGSITITLTKVKPTFRGCLSSQSLHSVLQAARANHGGSPCFVH